MENPTNELKVRCLKLTSGQDLIGFHKPNGELESNGGIELTHVNLLVMTKEGPQVLPFLPLMEGGLFALVQFGPQHFMFPYEPVANLQQSFRKLVDTAYNPPAPQATEGEQAQAMIDESEVGVPAVVSVPTELPAGVLAPDTVQ